MHGGPAGPRVAEEEGIHSSLSLRLFLEGDSFGALNLYAYTQDAFQARPGHPADHR